MSTKRERTPEQAQERQLFDALAPMAAVMRDELYRHWTDVHTEIATNIATQVKQSITQLQTQNPEDTTFAMADVEHYIKQTAQICIEETEFWLPEVAEDDLLGNVYYKEINS